MASLGEVSFRPQPQRRSSPGPVGKPCWFFYHTQKECNCFWALILELYMKSAVLAEKYNPLASYVGKLACPSGFLPASQSQMWGLICRKGSSAWWLVAWDQGSLFLSRGKKTNALFILCLCLKMRNFPWLLTFGVACSNPRWLRRETLDGTSDW